MFEGKEGHTTETVGGQQAIDDSTPFTKKTSIFSRRHLLGGVEADHGDLALLACCLVTGMVDAASFSNYAVFVGMQTGNTVILGLSTAGLPANPYAWLTTLISIICFLVGAFLTFRVSKVVTPTGITSNRLWTSTLLLIQGVFLVLAAALASPTGLVPQTPGSTNRDEIVPSSILDTPKIVALIPPLALQSGMQIATSRLLGFNELPVNVLTSTYCDLMGDYKLFALNNVKRTRRAVAVVLVLVGAIVSGWLLRSSAGLMGVLWVASGIKLLTGVAMFCFLPASGEKVLP